MTLSTLRPPRRRAATFLARAALVVALPVATLACDDATSPTEGTQNLVQVAQEAGSFQTLLSAAEEAGLVETLSRGGPYTLFAPDDAAFAKVPADILQRALADRTLLARILSFHIVPGRVTSSQVLSAASLTSVNGAVLPVRSEGGSAFVGDGRVVSADIQASNGIIHVVDAVLLPEPVLTVVETASRAGTFSTLLAVAEAAGLVEELAGAGPITVFAPTDAAFAKLPSLAVESLLADRELLRRVIRYHVVPRHLPAATVVGLNQVTSAIGAPLRISVDGGTVRVNDARVVATDIRATNGIIHVVDKVLLPGPVMDIPTTAASVGTFNTLLAAVEAAGLVETLKGAGPFTVFAPTDEAFAALPEGALQALLADRALLTRVLLYHVVPGSVPAEAVTRLSSARTVNGKSVGVSVSAEGVRVDDAKVVVADVFATNGVIHVIDKVLLPEPVLDIPGTAAAAGVFNTLLAAVEAAGLVETLKSAGPFTVFAPTDQAFAALPEGALAGLLADREALTRVLLYHVVPGAVDAATVVGLTEASTASGLEISIGVTDEGVELNGVKVIRTDVRATNGIIHVINGVLLPPTS